MIIECPDTKTAQEVYGVLSQHGVHIDLVHDEGPHQGDPPDPTVHVLINYTLPGQQETQVRAALRRIPGITVHG